MNARDLVFAAGYYKERIINSKTKSLILCNSFPKSGTHLLYQILYSLPGLKKWNDLVSVQSLCGVMNTSQHIRWKIGSAPSHAIIRSYLMYCNEVLDAISEFDLKHFFIYRDLRDVVVSHARWVANEERIFLHDIYVNQADFDRQIMSSIRGIALGTPFGSNLSQPDIGTDFSRWRRWLSHPGVLTLRFEDLVGERGGGSEEMRLSKIEQILDSLESSMSSQQIRSQFSSHALDPKESHTFMKGNEGSIGGWKKFFNDSHKQEFKKVAGELMIDLGYEHDLNW